MSGGPEYENKNTMKISLITDSYGIPINIFCTAGNFHNSSIFQYQFINNLFIVNIDLLNKILEIELFIILIKLL